MKLLQPTIVIDTLDALDLAYWHQQGIRGIFIDLDNTIAPWRQTAISAEARAFFGRAKEANLQVLLFTNAMEKRAREAALTVGVNALGMARKPFPGGYRRALQMVQLAPHQVMSIGDQVFTDVLGGNLAGCTTVLLPPLAEKEYWGTKLLRRFERMVGMYRPYRQSASR